MFMVVLILSLVSTTLSPFVYSSTVHFIAQPIAFIPPFITPSINTEPCYLIIHPVSLIVTSIFPNVMTLSIFLPKCILPFIFITVRPSLSTKSMLEIILPISFISSSCMMSKQPITMSLAFFPISIINITVRMCKFSFSICLVIYPIALILGSIRPCLHTISLFKLTFPCPFVYDPIFKFNSLFLYQRIFGCLYPLIAYIRICFQSIIIIIRLNLTIATQICNVSLLLSCFMVVSKSYFIYYGFSIIDQSIGYLQASEYYLVLNLFQSSYLLHCSHVFPIIFNNNNNTPAIYYITIINFNLPFVTNNISQSIYLFLLYFMQKPFFKFTEAINDNGTVWYTIQVHSKGSDPQPIIIKQRYSQLRQIHQRCLQTQYKNDLPEFPQKKLFGSTKDDFILKRKKELQNYYNTLSKTIDIQKLPELNKFIESHRKKKVQIKQSKSKEDDSNKIQTKIKQEQQLKKAFENIYKEVLSQFIDLSQDFYPIAETHEDSSKKFAAQINNAKPMQSALIADIKVEGVEDNETDFWSMFLKDEHEDFLAKSATILEQCRQIQKEASKNHSESIVVVK